MTRAVNILYLYRGTTILCNGREKACVRAALCVYYIYEYMNAFAEHTTELINLRGMFLTT